MSLALSEHQSGVKLRVERGDNGLLMSVVDENNEPIQGAHGVLTWTHSQNGILSQTSRSRGKTPMAGSGAINFPELGSGEHHLQLSLTGYKTYSQPIDIKQPGQRFHCSGINFGLLTTLETSPFFNNSGFEHQKPPYYKPPIVQFYSIKKYLVTICQDNRSYRLIPASYGASQRWREQFPKWWRLVLEL